jgi:photosystem II stability/assembly factor-like uncharacterized protein
MLHSHIRIVLAASTVALSAAATQISPGSAAANASRASTITSVARAHVTIPADSADTLTLDSAFLKSFEWRNIGPSRGGRSIAVSGVRGQPDVAYFGAAGGGLWKTTNRGMTWDPVTDGQVGSASVGAVAVSQSDPNVVYIGMGESCIRGDIMAGDGVYKSTDAGKTWTHVGFSGDGKQNISKIRIHPTNPDIVWVAVFGYHGAHNAERGVFKTTDGGKTWRKVLYRDDKTGAVDISVDPSNPDILYAALWEAYRLEYQMSSGGPGSGLFKSTDGGEHWTEITRNPGLPKGVVGRIGVAVSPADPNRIYALIENENGGLFSSSDAGATWELVNGDRRIRQRAFYYTHITADPVDADVVYVLNTSLYKSEDGGKTLTNVGRGTHGDHHDLWIDPDDPKHLVNGNDGGGAISMNGGRQWSEEDFPTAQFYHVITTNHIPYHVCGSQQDNSTACVSSGGGFGRGAPELYTVGGGEPGYIAADPKDLDVFFGGTNNGGFLTRYNRRTGQIREVNPYPRMFQGEPSSAVKERWQWTYPIIFSPADPDVLYTSSQHVWKTTDGGQNWTRISGDLTRHDPKTMGPSGGPITHDMNSPEIYATVFALGPGKHNVNVIWAGSDDGLIHVTRDGGKTWSNVTPKDMPEFGRVSQIDASSFDDGSAYVAVKKPLLNDVAPYAYRTHDFGKSWTKIVNGIRPNDYVHVVREDPARRGLLYAGTQHGAYISFDDGDNWQPLSLNLPDVPVVDLMVESNSIAIATHGRSFYTLDHIEPIRQYASRIAESSDPHLFAPDTAIRPGTTVALQYWLRQPADTLTIEILDGAGKVIRTYTAEPRDTTRRDSTAAAGDDDDDDGPRRRGPRGPSMEAGLHMQEWDMHYASATTFPGMILWGATTSGPMALPGNYTARLTVDGKTLTQPVVLKLNPLEENVTLAGLREQFELGMRIRDKVSEANEAVIRIRDMKKQTADRLTKSSDPALTALADTFTRHLSDVEEAIYQVRNRSGQDPLNFPIKINNRLATLLRTVTRGDGEPIGAAEPIFNDLSAELEVETNRLAKVIAQELVRLNAMLEKLGVEKVGEGEVIS